MDLVIGTKDVPLLGCVIAVKAERVARCLGLDGYGAISTKDTILLQESYWTAINDYGCLVEFDGPDLGEFRRCLWTALELLLELERTEGDIQDGLLR